MNRICCFSTWKNVSMHVSRYSVAKRRRFAFENAQKRRSSTANSIATQTNSMKFVISSFVKWVLKSLRSEAVMTSNVASTGETVLAGIYRVIHVSITVVIAVSCSLYAFISFRIVSISLFPLFLCFLNAYMLLVYDMSFSFLFHFILFFQTICYLFVIVVVFFVVNSFRWI